jgi:hypothetical protein
LTDAHTAGVGAGATVNGEGASLGLWGELKNAGVLDLVDELNRMG